MDKDKDMDKNADKDKDKAPQRRCKELKPRSAHCVSVDKVEFFAAKLL